MLYEMVTHLQIHRAIDQENVLFPIAASPLHFNHSLTHLHKRIGRCFQNLGKVRFTIEIVNQRRFVNRHDFVQNVRSFS